MPNIFKDLPYSHLVYRQITFVKKDASACNFPLDLTYLDLVNALNLQEIRSRTGINHSSETQQVLDTSRLILLHYGISDSPTALAHLERIKEAIAVWRDRKAEFDREMESKLADLEHAFVEECPLPFVLDREVSNA